MGTFESLSTEDSPRGFQKEEHAAGLFLYGRFFNISPRSLLSLEVFPEITSPRCPVIGRGRTMRAPAPAVAVQMPTSGTLQLQSLRNRRRGSLLLPSRRKTPNFPAKRLLSYPRVLKGNICLQGRAHAWAGGLLSHRGLCWFNSIPCGWTWRSCRSVCGIEAASLPLLTLLCSLKWGVSPAELRLVLTDEGVGQGI